METLSLIIMLVSYAVIALWAYFIYENRKNELNSHFSEVWDSFSNTIFSRYGYLTYVSLILLLLVISLLSMSFLSYFVYIWIVTSFVIPFMILPISNRKKYNIISAILFIISTFIAFSFFLHLDLIRDSIGETFVDGYSVYYTEEAYVDDIGDEKAASIAHITTGNDALDLFYIYGFPVLHKILIALFIFYNIKIKLYVGSQNLVIIESKAKIK